MKRLMIVAFSALLLVSNLASQTKGKTAPYTGDGGKGLSLAILAPKGNGLATSQDYLPDLVQGEFVSNFSGYSAISVLDRVSLDKVIAETLDPTYKDNLDIVRLGHITQTGYIMTGTVTKTASGYALQAQITSTADGMTKASYSGTCTAAELDNLIGVRRASLELLGKMNVQLTERAKQELSSAGQTNYVNAQTALAQGIVAQRSGNTVETMARFYEANNYDPSLAEAAARANAVSSTIRTGSLGQNFRNDLAWRAEWEKILKEAEDYLWQHSGGSAEVSYTNLGLKPGKADFQNGTMEFKYNPNNVWIKGMPYPRSSRKLINDLNSGLLATGRNMDWKLPWLTAPGERFLFRDRTMYDGKDHAITITFTLINSYGYEIDRNSCKIFYIYNGQGTWFVSWWDSEEAAIVLGLGLLSLPIWVFWAPVYLISTPIVVMHGVKHSMGTLAHQFNDRKVFTVRAGDITDQMTIEVTTDNDRFRVIQK